MVVLRLEADDKAPSTSAVNVAYSIFQLFGVIKAQAHRPIIPSPALFLALDKKTPMEHREATQLS